MAIVEAPFMAGLGAKLTGRSAPEDQVVIRILPAPSEPEFLGEVPLYQHGSFRRVRSYFRGWHSELGGVFTTKGLQGKETIVEHDAIRPIRTFMAQEARTNGHMSLNGHGLRHYSIFSLNNEYETGFKNR